MTEGKRTCVLEGDDIMDIIKASYEDIHRFCYWRTRNQADALDITQETFVRFFESLDRYYDLGKPKALLYTIARNLCIGHMKKVKLAFLPGYTQQDTLSDPDSIIDKMDLSNAISLLPDPQQEILLMRFGQGLRIGEIAAILGQSRFKVMYTLRIALDLLKKLTKEVRNYEIPAENPTCRYVSRRA